VPDTIGPLVGSGVVGGMSWVVDVVVSSGDCYISWMVGDQARGIMLARSCPAAQTGCDVVVVDGQGPWKYFYTRILWCFSGGMRTWCCLTGHRPVSLVE
jgi:hypothetical protein